MQSLESTHPEFSEPPNSSPSAATPVEPPHAPAEGICVAPLAEPALPASGKVAEAESLMAGVAHGLWSWVLPATFFMSVVVLVVYATPFLLNHWRLTEAQADAEASYLRRRAELKAEAEHAEEQLDFLDKRVHFTSLGFREVVRKTAPHVVNVVNLRDPKKGDTFGKRQLFFDQDKDRKFAQQGVGSGILVKPGYVLTNYHVVHEAQRLRITFASGRSIGVDPDTVTADPITDLAVIQLPTDLPANLKDDINVSTPFADSDKDVQVGDWALAIGSPLGLRQTVTQGVVSAKGRLLGLLDMVELIQTDAAINPGNSGGPLFDQHGRIMGINVAIASDTGGNQGIGFAIPSNTAKRIFEQLLAKGEVSRGYLGIGLDEVTGAQAKVLGLKDQGGVAITLIQPKQAADNAGLIVGDVITAVNNESLPPDQPARQLRQFIVDTEPDGALSLEVLRDGQKWQFQVKVGKRPVSLP